MAPSTIRVVATAFVVGLFVVACGEPHSHMSEAEDRSPPGESSNQGGGGGGGGGIADGDYYLEPITATEGEASLGGSVPIGVALSDDSGQAASHEEVQFEIIDSTGGDGIQLDAVTVFTDNNGHADNRVVVGDTAGVITVQATHAEAGNAINFDIEATTVPAGDLNVGVHYDTADLLEVSDVEVRFWRTYDMECAFIGPYALPPTPYIDEDTLPTIDDDVTFQSLQTTEEYTVTVTGHGPQGQIAAHGCVDEVDIEADQVNELIVDLDLLNLNANGTYQLESEWDFSEALAASGPVGGAIVDAFEWIENPADMAADYMVGLAVDWVCDEYGTVSWECGTAQAAQAEGSAESSLAGFIEDQIDDIGILNDFQNMADDLRATVEELKIESILTIDGKATDGLDVGGSDIWRAAYVYWTHGCDDDDPPDCGEIRLGLGDNTQFGLLEADWEGQIRDYNRLEIDPHEMMVPYGQFITHVLRQHLIPALTGGEENSLSGAFEYLLCDNLGSFEVWGVGFDASTMQGFCSTTFGVVGGLAEIYIHNLEYDIDLQIAGDAELFDYDSDGDVDVIENGLFYGELEGEDGETVDLQAEFDGVRID